MLQYFWHGRVLNIVTRLFHVYVVHVETVETTSAIVSTEKVTHVSTEKVTEVTSQPGSEPTSHIKDAMTSSPMSTPLSELTTLPQSGPGSCNYRFYAYIWMKSI